ncbi:MAG: hypothetical protein IJ521_07810 [Schwartzia sp.]|nr:hypothetical protein [Schwartzia sp. (in: firmicutes)]
MPGFIHRRQRPLKSKLVLRFAKPNRMMYHHSMQKINGVLGKLLSAHVFRVMDFLHGHNNSLHCQNG